MTTLDLLVLSAAWAIVTRPVRPIKNKAAVTKRVNGDAMDIGLSLLKFGFGSAGNFIAELVFEDGPKKQVWQYLKIKRPIAGMA
jgi:hypothetical protein